jgi:hypothetical protein
MCPYYLDGDLDRALRTRSGDTRLTATGLSQWSLSVAMQFSRAAERTRWGIPTHSLSKLNSMLPLDTDGMPVWQGQVRSTC